MATNIFKLGGHVVAESTKLAATHGTGHIYNVEVPVTEAGTSTVDNGKLVSVSEMDYLRPEVYSLEVPTDTSKVGLVLTTPLIYEESPAGAQNPANFFNDEGDIARVYDLTQGDIFLILEDGIDALATAPVVGNYVKPDGMNIAEIATAPVTGFVGKIVGKVVRTNGTFYKIQVLANAGQ